jgi:hypothetical protein
MSFTRWLRTLRYAIAPQQLERKHRLPRPRLEALEDRCLLSLSPAVSYGIPSSPQDATFGDFNGDGRIDVATVNSSQLSILYGNGSGGFGSAQNTAVSSYLTSVAVGHFNGDGRLDVAVTCTRINNGAWQGVVHVLLNNGNDANGNATFQAARTFDTGTNTRPGALVTGDLNGDGMVDVAAAQLNGSNVTVLLGNGSGDLQTARQFAVGSSPGSIAVGDLNNDNKLDLITANRGSNNLSVLLNNSTSGNLGFEAARNSTIAAGAVQSVAVGDLDGNGLLDLVATSNVAIPHTSTYTGYYGGTYYSTYYTYEGHVNVLLGTGSGNLGTATATLVGPNELGDLTVGDMNCDGNLDVITADGVVAVYVDPTVLLGYGNGTFDTPYYFAAGSGPNTVMVAELNGDDHPDVMTANTYSSNVSVMLNDCNWPVLGAPFVSISGPSAGPISVTENNDGTTTVAFTISLSVASEQTLSVDYSTIDGTALAGSDYVAKSGTATFLAGQMSQTIEVQIMGDRIGELDEYFQIALSNPVNARLGTTQAYISIVDDEPRVSITGATITEGNTGTQEAEFTVNLAVAYDQDVNVEFTTVDGSAAAGSDYVAKSGTVTILKGETSAKIKVQINGDRLGEQTQYTGYDYYYGYYAYSDYSEYFDVKLTSSDHGAIVTDQASGIILDDEPRISISPMSMTEGNEGTKEAEFVVTLSNVYDVDVNIDFTTANGSAAAGSDFVGQSGTLTIKAGDTIGKVKVLINGDRVGEQTEYTGYDWYYGYSYTYFEDNEYFSVNLTGSDHGTIVTGQANGTILDDEPRISISGMNVIEGNAGTTEAKFTVYLQQAYDVDVNISYATANGSALAGSDYQAKTGIVTIPKGQTSATISVLVNGDRLAEGSEYFNVNLSNPSAGLVQYPTASLYILDDEPSISIGNVYKNEGRSGTTTFTFAVYLSAAYDQDVTVNFQTVNGTAKAGSDFQAKSGTLTILKGQTVGYITISVYGDRSKESDEYFSVQLFGNSSNSTISNAWGTGWIYDDDRNGH